LSPATAQDFESLKTYEFSLIWNSNPQHGLIGEIVGESHWSWKQWATLIGG